MSRPLPEPTPEQRAIAKELGQKAMRGWYTGTEETLLAYGARALHPSRAEPELSISVLLSRDKMHHSVGWWRNADYEYCWHMSIAAVEAEEIRRFEVRQRLLAGTGFDMPPPPWEDIPEIDLRSWAVAFFGEHVNKVWFEPGGTDPRLTADEKRGRAHMKHLRLFLDPETLQPFIPTGEVYHLTRWIPGLTPEKVDR